MALTPQAMMNLRRGPTQGPQPNPGGAPPGAPPAGMPATPGSESPGNILMTAIAKKMSEQKRANADFATKTIDQVMRVIATMQIHIGQMHAEAAHDLNQAWSKLSSAKKKLGDSMKESVATASPGPPLGFSGAQIAPTQMGPPGAGGGMGTPS